MLLTLLCLTRSPFAFHGSQKKGTDKENLDDLASIKILYSRSLLWTLYTTCKFIPMFHPTGSGGGAGGGRGNSCFIQGGVVGGNQWVIGEFLLGWGGGGSYPVSFRMGGGISSRARLGEYICCTQGATSVCSLVTAATQNQEKFEIISKPGPISRDVYVTQNRSFHCQFTEQVIVGNILSQVIFLLNYWLDSTKKTRKDRSCWKGVVVCCTSGYLSCWLNSTFCIKFECLTKLCNVLLNNSNVFQLVSIPRRPILNVETKQLW